MPVIRPLPVLVLAFILSASSFTQSPSQPTIWASKPDVAGFEKIVNDRLAAANAAIAQISSVKGARTIANTLEPFDNAVQQINSSLYFSTLMQQAHPGRDFPRPRITTSIPKSSNSSSQINYVVSQGSLELWRMTSNHAHRVALLAISNVSI